MLATEKSSSRCLHGFTTWFRVADVLVAESLSPSYSAVIECEPAASVDLLRLATFPLSAADPSVVVPSRNTTCPVGLGPELATVAVKVIALPELEGFGLDARTVVVGYFV